MFLFFQANRLQAQDVIVEHPQTQIYKKIVEANSVLRAIISVMNEGDVANESTIMNDVEEHTRTIFNIAKGNSPYEKMYNAWQDLQTNVDQIWDMNMGGKDITGNGVKQVFIH